MRVLRRFPSLAPALRDGRVCLSTASLLGQVLTEENVVELVARAAYRTKKEVEELVVSIKPRPTPAEGVRKLPAPAASPTASPGVQGPEACRQGSGPPLALPLAPTSTPPTPVSAPASSGVETRAARASASEVRPVAEERWSALQAAQPPRGGTSLRPGAHGPVPAGLGRPNRWPGVHRKRAGGSVCGVRECGRQPRRTTDSGSDPSTNDRWR
jgi:hypothetical protein